MTSNTDITAISTEGQALLDYARRDPERTVPQYPTWTQRDLVAHVAAVHGRTITICRTLPTERVPFTEQPERADLFDWYERTLEEMVRALESADPDAEVWTIVAGAKLGWWTRRMAIETSIHRWDAQQAVEDPAPLLPLVATFGLDEFPEMYLAKLGEVPALELEATDIGRMWRFGEGAPTASVSGTASDLYLRLMSRPGVELPETWATAVDGLWRPA